MNAVTNSGPLIAISKLGLSHLLGRLYRPLSIPDAVYEEVVTRGIIMQQPDAFSVQLAVARRELVVRDVSDEEGVAMASFLHRGERAAIMLAQQTRADWVLLDDQAAREYATGLGLHVKGTLGVIVEFYRHALIDADEAELIFSTILARDDIWISNRLVQRVRDTWRRERGLAVEA